MNDAKNIFIAWLSAGSPLLAAAASETGVTLLSAIVLPVLFFAIGKTVDVLLQIYLSGRNTSGNECAPQAASVPAMSEPPASAGGRFFGRNTSSSECAPKDKYDRRTEGTR